MRKEELEKEAEEYADRHWGASPSVIRALKQTYLAGAEPREKRIAELEKENAELKLKLEALEGQTPWKDIKDKSELMGKLTNAKELIKKLKALYFSPVVTNDDVKRQDEILNEAEQFIKEIKEK